MNKAVSNVKIYACNKATKHSNTSMNNANPTATGEIHHVLKTKIKPTKLITMMCPAVMFANKRIINANGLVRIPTTSNGTKIMYKAFGAGGAKIWCQ